MDKYLMQILKNQRHILEVLDEMHRAGKVSSGIFCGDTVGKELRKETYQLVKELNK